MCVCVCVCVCVWIYMFVYILEFPCGSDGKESAHKAGDLDLIPGLGGSPGEGYGYPLLIFWPGEFHAQRSLAGYSPWGRRRVGHNWVTEKQQLKIQWKINSTIPGYKDEFCADRKLFLIPRPHDVKVSNTETRIHIFNLILFVFKLAVLGLSCGTCPLACELLVPLPGIEPTSLHWKVKS